MKAVIATITHEKTFLKIINSWKCQSLIPDVNEQTLLLLDKMVILPTA